MNRHLYDEEALMKDYPLAARTAHPEGTVIPCLLYTSPSPRDRG